jgi:ABC-type phosphate transport system substrate-binding protein
MRKIMLMVAMLAVVLVAAAPAIAQVAQGFSEKRDTSGKASPSFSFSNKGDNVNACPSDQQVANTGNVFNEQGAVQYNDTTEDIDFAGSSVTITPAESSECSQTMGQAAAAK